MQLYKLISLVLFAFGRLESVNGQTVVCPAVRTSSGWLDLFPLPCKKHSECRVMGNQHLCCKGFCTKGVPGAAQQIRGTGASQNNVVQSSSTSTTTTTTSTTTTTTTTTTTPSTTSSTTTTPKPTEAPRPFLQLLPIQSSPPTVTKTKASTKTGKSQKLVCPKAGQAPVLLFPIPCETNAQCRASSGPDQVCCDNRCVKGVPAPRPTSAPKSHQRDEFIERESFEATYFKALAAAQELLSRVQDAADALGQGSDGSVTGSSGNAARSALLGVIPRECPSAPLGELLFEVQSCKSDADCWPRVCCPDGTRSYCRTAKARLDLVPVARQIDAPVRMLEQYLQCTPPPQYDLFPQKCSSSVDCFPNLCCAEGGKKHCRPPQRSLLGLLAGVTRTIGSTLGNLRQNQAQANANKVR